MLAATWAALGCGYTAGYDASRSGPRTVAVRIAGNETFRQRQEQLLTRELAQAVTVYSSMRPTTFAAADAILEVDIVDIRTRPLVQGRPEPMTEGALAYAVSARLVDRRSGAVLRERRVLDRAEFRTSVGENEASAGQEAAADLARKIVLALEADF
jgi:hypothetical protein